MEKEFRNWLAEELERRGWSSSELARRAGVVPSTVSQVLSGANRPGFDLCIGVAQALGERPDYMLRRAGLLPPLPSTVEEEEEMLTLFRRLPDGERKTMMVMLRALVSRGQATATALPGEELGPDFMDDRWVPELLEEFRRVPDGWQEAAIEELARVRRFASLPAARIIGDDEAEGGRVETRRRAARA
jgi:transcriptional regulator with XRE-family HTH domain